MLNMTGGPSNLNWNADAHIIISADSREVYKQPLFYAFGHVSKFILPDSVRIDYALERPNFDLRIGAFLRPDNLIAVVVLNK